VAKAGCKFSHKNSRQNMTSKKCFPLLQQFYLIFAQSAVPNIMASMFFFNAAGITLFV